LDYRKFNDRRDLQNLTPIYTDDTDFKSNRGLTRMNADLVFVFIRDIRVNPRSFFGLFIQ